MRRLWVYKCNATDPNNEGQGDWDYFFKKMRGRGRWGGTDCIFNPSSRQILLEEMKKGDLVLAWQTDRRVAIGLCVVDLLQIMGGEANIHLKKLMVFPGSVAILGHKKSSRALAEGKAFVQGKLGTLFETTPEEAQEIARLCGFSSQLGT